jgi:hypothetical protein
MTAYKKIVRDRAQLIADLKYGNPINVEGYLLTPVQYQQMLEINLLETIFKPTKDLLFLQMVRDDKQPISRELEEIRRLYTAEGANTELVRIVGDDFWKDTKKYKPNQKALGDAAIAWLHRVSSGVS